VKRFVLDVNSWVSVFYRDRHPYLIKLIEEEEIAIFTSMENISEFADIHTKHKKIAKLLPLHTSVYVETMEEIGKVFAAQKRYALLPDYKDNYLIDLSHQTRAILVTNDKHFRVAKKLRSPQITIISLQEFYQMLNL
jgi:putative PIN family toxin of toxin-antitoxin system